MIVVTTGELGPIPVEAAAQVLGVPAGELLVIIKLEDGPVEPQPAFKPADDYRPSPGVKAITSPVIAPDLRSDAQARGVYTPSALPATAEVEPLLHQVDAARQRRHDTLAISAATLGLKDGTWGGDPYGRPWWRRGAERI